MNCLALSLDGQTLISGGSDNQILVWNIPSRQLVKTLHFKGPITNIKLRLTNPAVFNPEHKQPQTFCSNLKRMIDPPEQDEEQAVEVLVSASYDEEYGNIESSNAKSKDITLSGGQIMISAVNNANSDNTNELECLRQEVQKLRRINKKLFEVSSKQLLRLKK